jgi:hypothetical protein
VGPKELERMIFELAVTSTKDEMKERCLNYVTPNYVKKANPSVHHHSKRESSIGG